MMTTVPRPQLPPGDPKPAKRSLLGLLFKPQLGPTLSPLRETTRIFVKLVAGVFAIYKLIPKNYPALSDPNAPISFSNVLATAWQNLRFTREGAPQAILFFAIVGIMGFSFIIAICTFLSLFIGHAHAATTDTSMFTAPSSSDLAQNLIEYLFDNGAYPQISSSYGGNPDQMQDPFAGSFSLQSALATALGFYSDAILVVAAMLLFYHLTAMVVETAHHGVPMGKRASQIWAPIRLVVAIGLLVPISSGLNSGQYIVIKIAEMGSALASNVWVGFLTQLANYSGKPVAPPGALVQQVASDIVRMKACQLSWNYHLKQVVSTGGVGALAGAAITSPTSFQFMLGNVPGTKTSYSSTALSDVDVCGWYFIPSGEADALSQQAARAQATAITENDSNFQQAANKINDILNGQPATPITFGAEFQNAVQSYQLTLNKSMSALVNGQESQVQSSFTTIQPYGWLMAGTFLNMIERVQAGLASAAADTLPKSSPPEVINQVDTSQEPAVRGGGRYFNPNTATMSRAWDIRLQVATDMANFGTYETNSLASTSNAADVQCASMVGLGAQTSGWGGDAVNAVFGLVDTIASINGVWASGDGTSCGSTNANSTYKTGIQIGGNDPFAQMAFLGHANLKTAFDVVGLVVAGKLTGGLLSIIPFIGPAIGGVVNSVMSAATPILLFFALVFWAGGFTLAFLLPLMPFMRFLFAALAWFGAVIEAIVAIPLVALAHLNPEGEGLPGQSARGAYFFVFNLFLRPVLTVFGLICGLLMFLIAVSFLNYTYAIAVASSGATAYGLASMSKMIYSILYVAILYICANHCFQLIDHLPEHALKWMGSAGQAIQKMGDVGQIEGYGTAIGAYAGKQGMGAIGQSASAVGNAYNKSRDKKLAQKDKDENFNNEERRHQEVMNALTQNNKQIPP